MKKIILIILSVICLACFFACGNEDESVSSSESVQASESVSNSQSVESAHTHAYVKHDAVAPTCQEDGNEEYYTCSGCNLIFNANKTVIQAIPTLSAAHSYQLKAEVAGNCTVKGKIAHYECSSCHNLFDLLKNPITSIDGEYDYNTHAQEVYMTVASNPTKLVYKVGDAFDPTGMVLTLKCQSCEGKIVDNSQLSFEYQTENAVSFAFGDTKVTVKYMDLDIEVSVTVEKQSVQITGVEESYATTCGAAPVIEAVSSISSLPILVEYYDDQALVSPSDFVAGNEYTARVFVEETEGINGAEVFAAVTVEHSYGLVVDDSSDKCEFVCACEDKKNFYALTNQQVYVDSENTSIDLSALVVGTANYSVVDIKQVKDGELTDIEGENEGLVYSFSLDKYEQHNPPKLTLIVTLEIEGITCDVSITSRCADKIITNAEDLDLLTYKGAAFAETGGEAKGGYYVLGGDIDASEFIIDNSCPAFEAGIGFCGTLDGQGYTISNLTVPGYSHGLFGAIGYGAVIKDVSLTNVTVPVEVTQENSTYVLAFAIRNATLSGVSISFSEDSLGFKLANEINDTILENVNLYTANGHSAAFAMSRCEGEISYEYMPYATVAFDTDGGDEIESVEVILGKKLNRPADPQKASSDEVDYIFLGWYLDGEEFDFDTAIGEDITLVAKWEEREKVTADEVMAQIAVLPDNVTMPDHTFFVSRILNAKKAYDELPSDEQAQVENYSKLEGLLEDISGYESVFTPSLLNADVVPAYVPNYTATVGGTASTRVDDLYGNVFTATSEAEGRASIVFSGFPDMSKYTTVYIWLRVVGASCDIYLSDGIVNDGWGADWMNTWSMDGFWVNDGNWICKAVDVSTGIFKNEWSLGVRTNQNGVVIEVADIVAKAAPISPDTATGLTFGNFVNSGLTNEYGVVYNFTQGWASGTDMGAFNENALSGAVLSGHNALYFWIYNPNATDVSLSFTGEMNGWNPQGDHVTLLKAGEWTKVVITPEIIAQGNSGNWFVNVTTGAGASGWQISAIYSTYIA